MFGEGAGDAFGRRGRRRWGWADGREVWTPVRAGAVRVLAAASSQEHGGGGVGPAALGPPRPGPSLGAAVVGKKALSVVWRFAPVGGGVAGPPGDGKY